MRPAALALAALCASPALGAEWSGDASLASAMAASKTLVDSARRPRRRVPADALRIPIVEQETDYSCGPASLLGALRYWGRRIGSERDLYGPLGTTPKDGTHPKKLVEVARSFGLSARVAEGLSLDDLRRALSRGETAIVDLQAWRDENAPRIPWRDAWEDGHYVVLAAISEDAAFFMDPSAGGAYAWAPLSELLERWHDYEDEGGRRRVYERMAVILSGAAPAGADPDAVRRLPVRMK